MELQKKTKFAAERLAAVLDNAISSLRDPGNNR
jgi:hypothetical protein